MKKLILFAAILFAGVSVVKADEPVITTDKDQVKLNVTLNPIQTILVNGAEEVNLVYNDIRDYQLGVTNEMKDHLTIHSSGKFKVTVKSDAENLTGGSKEIKVGTITIGATGKGAAATARPLTTNEVELINKTDGGANLKYNVTYKGAGEYAYMDHYSSAEGAKNTYTTNVLYTISAD